MTYKIKYITPLVEAYEILAALPTVVPCDCKAFTVSSPIRIQTECGRRLYACMDIDAECGSGIGAYIRSAYALNGGQHTIKPRLFEHHQGIQALKALIVPRHDGDTMCLGEYRNALDRLLAYSEAMDYAHDLPAN